MRFSIIIPNYNSGKYLAKSLDSIFKQTFKDFEVIVADGYSTDNSMEIIKKYQKVHDNLYVYLTESSGEVAHINYGMSKARGEIVSWLCADDSYEHDCLEVVNEYFKNLTTQWVYGKVKIINDRDNEVRGIVTNAKEVIQPRYQYYNLQCVCFISEPSVFMRRRFYQEIGEYDNRLALTADYDYWLRAGKLSHPVFIDHHLANWRAHDGSTSVNNYKLQMIQAYEVQKRYSGFWLRPIQWLICKSEIALYKIMK
jgi:glycosyltransferase involved in cell wall biosynthesis